MDSLGSLEDLHFETVEPAVRTRRPPSVPPLAIPGGVGIGSLLKWPSAPSTASGYSTLCSSGTSTFCAAQAQVEASSADRLSFLRAARGSNNSPEPLKVSKLCSPALHKKALVSPISSEQAVDFPGGELYDAPAGGDVDAPLGLDLEALERV